MHQDPPTKTSTLAQTLWRKQRLLTQEVLQAFGKTHASDDSVFKAELEKFQAFVSHVRALVAAIDAQRALLKTVGAGWAAVDDHVMAASGSPASFAWRAPQLSPVDDALGAAIHAIESKLADLDAIDKDVKARADAKLEFDSLSRVKSDAAALQAAADELDQRTLALFRAFAKLEAARAVYLSSELDTIRVAFYALHRDAKRATSTPPPVVSLEDVQAKEDEIFAQLAKQSWRHALPPPPVASTFVMEIPAGPRRRTTLPKAPGKLLSTAYAFKRFSTKPIISAFVEEDEIDDNDDQSGNQDDIDGGGLVLETLDLNATDSSVLGSDQPHNPTTHPTKQA
ncbi:Aste57867_24553 [Aphanomyces stellatus]|uniref:Aste57867_24553 protein n=1 Tax=Aphanomyces stellatus TaxID=120398 RepID=A0A485LQN9_9STRA|nr:hypothetical protein As57867_024476 [Aphanomyces stellatus]VFU01192.1 Aste57867_24553 [Aphanomyces stellatus]